MGKEESKEAMTPTTPTPGTLWRVLLSDAQQRCISDAISRGEPYHVCPTRGLHAASQSAVLNALRTRQLITDAGIPVLTDLGIHIARTLTQPTEP